MWRMLTLVFKMRTYTRYKANCESNDFSENVYILQSNFERTISESLSNTKDNGLLKRYYLLMF